jgi:hypothetical protein
MASRHFIDHHLNFKRMFGEAVQQSVIDATDRSKIVPGFYRIRLPGKDRPLVAARIYERLPDDGDTPAGEILGEPCDPVLVWTGRDRQPLIAPEGYTVENWYRYLCADAAWAKAHAPEEPAARPRRPVDLAALPPIPPPRKQ